MVAATAARSARAARRHARRLDWHARSPPATARPAPIVDASSGASVTAPAAESAAAAPVRDRWRQSRAGRHAGSSHGQDARGRRLRIRMDAPYLRAGTRHRTPRPPPDRRHARIVLRARNATTTGLVAPLRAAPTRTPASVMLDVQQDRVGARIDHRASSSSPKPTSIPPPSAMTLQKPCPSARRNRASPCTRRPTARSARARRRAPERRNTSRSDGYRCGRVRTPGPTRRTPASPPALRCPRPPASRDGIVRRGNGEQ